MKKVSQINPIALNSIFIDCKARYSLQGVATNFYVLADFFVSTKIVKKVTPNIQVVIPTYRLFSAAIRPTYIPPRRPSDPLLDPNFKPISRSSNNKKNSIDNQEDPKIQKSSVYPGGKGSKSTPLNFLNLLLLTFVAFNLS